MRPSVSVSLKRHWMLWFMATATMSVGIDDTNVGCVVSAFQQPHAVRQRPASKTWTFRPGQRNTSNSLVTATTRLELAKKAVPAKSSGLTLFTVGKAIDTLWRKYPFLAAGFTCGLKASLADIVAQKRQMAMNDASQTTEPSSSEETSTSSAKQLQQKSAAVGTKFDLRRNVAFTVYGALYQGMAQEFIYNHMYSIWFGSGTSITTVLSKVLFDLLVQVRRTTNDNGRGGCSSLSSLKPDNTPICIA